MPKKVLIVDADINCWKGIVTSLENTEYYVSYSGTLDDALDKLQTQRFDLIIVDLCWPRLEGLNFISRLSQLQPEATVIAVSESADSELEQETLNDGAHFCLTKPLNQEDLLQVFNSALSNTLNRQESSLNPCKNLEQSLLRGFTPEQQRDFSTIGTIRNYELGDVIPMNDESGSMIWVERGRLMVCYNDVPVEGLGEGEFWGEAAFVNPSAVITYLIAQEDVQIRHFTRKRLIDFFAYHDETLTKRYMINLINCLHMKWNRTISRLVKASMPAITLNNEDTDAPEL